MSATCPHCGVVAYHAHDCPYPDLHQTALASAPKGAEPPQSTADYQQRRGVFGDIVDEAIAAYRQSESDAITAYQEWERDDELDALRSIMKQMIKRRNLYADHANRASRGAEPAKGADQRRVVCAAIRAADGSLLLGIRHYSRDMHVQIESRHDGHKFIRRNGDDQGFVDQWGVYMTRGEAYKVAEASGQVLHPGYCGNTLDGLELYSEGLY
jgi:hypothetical protein